jgi:hypothetical protein
MEDYRMNGTQAIVDNIRDMYRIAALKDINAELARYIKYSRSTMHNETGRNQRNKAFNNLSDDAKAVIKTS